MCLLARYQQILEALVAEPRATYGARLVACAGFGSVGRSTPRWGSDVDLLVVVRGLPRGRFARLEEFLSVVLAADGVGRLAS
jgi:predicted nucleotidyltransferase